MILSIFSANVIISLWKNASQLRTITNPINDNANRLHIE